MNTNSIKNFSWGVAVSIVVGVGLLTAGLSVFLQTRVLAGQPLREAVEQPVVVAVALPVVPKTTDVGSSYAQPNQPARLVIPAIGVNAKIQSVGLSWRGNGDMGVPTNTTDVGWYSKGPLPGVPGSAVIDGHLDGKEVPKGVFYDLDKLQIGDIVQVIDSEGVLLQFRVIETKTYDAEAPTADVFSSNSKVARLNLVTCAGNWNAHEKVYDKRIVVFTELVST